MKSIARDEEESARARIGVVTFLWTVPTESRGMVNHMAWREIGVTIADRHESVTFPLPSIIPITVLPIEHEMDGKRVFVSNRHPAVLRIGQIKMHGIDGEKGPLPCHRVTTEHGP